MKSFLCIAGAPWCVANTAASSFLCSRASVGSDSKHLFSAPLPCRRNAQVPMGSWHDAGQLDAADKRLSKPIFQLSLPAAIEVCISVPGAFMAFPHAFLGPIPLAIAKLVALTTSTGVHALLDVMIVCFWAAGLLFFYGGLVGWLDFKKALVLVIFAFPALTSAVLASCALPSHVELACLRSLTCALLTVVLLIPAKAACNRVRPAVALGLVDQVSKRRSALMVPYIKSMCAAGQSRESMPSADAGIMAANAMVLCQVWTLASMSWIPKVVGGCLLISCCFGRMYFWAHHLLDVLVGAGAGACVAVCTIPFGFGTRRWHVFVSYIAFLIALIAMQKRTKVFNDGSRVSKGS